MTMSIYARQQLVDFQEVGYGSAAATLLFVVIAADDRRHADGRAGRPVRRQEAMNVARRLRQAGFALLVGLIVLVSVFPFYYAIVTSFRTGTEIFSVSLWPKALHLDNYVVDLHRAAFRAQHPQFGRRRLRGRGRCRCSSGSPRPTRWRGCRSAAAACCC